jgi:hypothetical protein
MTHPNILSIINATYSTGNESWKNMLNLSDISVPCIKCQLGTAVSSNIFQSNIASQLFQELENKIKVKCNLENIPYHLINEYSYDTYLYETNSHTDKLYQKHIVNSRYLTTHPHLHIKYTYYRVQHHNSVHFNCSDNYNNIQPALVANLKLGNNIYIKLKKNLSKYDINSPVISSQLFVEYEPLGDTINTDFELLSKILADLLQT